MPSPIYDRNVTESPEGPGCRDAAIATGFLLAIATVFMITGLGLARGDACTGACETLALTLLYAGGPISALFGVFVGGVTVAWPLEITLWVVAGFAVARWAERRETTPIRMATVVVLIALVYGLVLSQFVEIAV